MSSAFDVSNISNSVGGCVAKREETDKTCGVDARSTSTSESDKLIILYCLHIVLPAGVNTLIFVAPCGLQGGKNGPAPFPRRMSYKATKPGQVSVLYPELDQLLLKCISITKYKLHF